MFIEKPLKTQKTLKELELELRYDRYLYFFTLEKLLISGEKILMSATLWKCVTRFMRSFDLL